MMAKIAADYSDRVILTSDNPRTEDPEVILDDMEKGLDETEKNGWCVSQTGKKLSGPP